MAIKGRFAVLDGLRGLAAVAVMLRHLGEQFHVPHLARHGYLAVDFFFVLSGFVIGHAYEHKLGGSLTRRGFVLTRLVRLYPLILLGVATGVVVMVLQHQPRHLILEAGLLNALALPYLWSGELFPVNSPLWSMMYEGASNLAYIGLWPRLGGRVLIGLTALAAAALVLIGVRTGSLDTGFANAHRWAGAPRLAFPFLAGLLIYRWGARRGPKLPSLSGWALAGLMAALLFLPQGSGLTRLAVDLAAALILLPGLVGLGARAATGAAGAWVCQIAGELSYPIYILHKPIITVLAPFVGHAPLQRGVAAMACAALIVMLSWGAHRFYDVPVRRWLMARLPRQSTPAPTSAEEATGPLSITPSGAG